MVKCLSSNGANDDFRLFVNNEKKNGIWGNSFSYTLIESKDI